MFPFYMFGVDCYDFYVIDPIAHEGEEGASSFLHSLLPSVFFEQLV